MVRKICTYLCDNAYGVFSYYSDNNFIHENFPPCVVPSTYLNLIRPGRYVLLKGGNLGKGSIIQC